MHSNCNFDRKVHKVCKHLDGMLGVKEVQGSRAVVASSRKRPTPMRTKGRKKGENVWIKKKLILKSTVLELNFGNKGAIPTSLACSRQEGAPK